ncbi:MAG: hypothetical protein WBM13_07620 [Bacteroidia bacterium]
MEIEFNADNAWETTLDWNPDSKVDKTKRFKTFTKRVVPKNIL